MGKHSLKVEEYEVEEYFQIFNLKISHVGHVEEINSLVGQIGERRN